jgi:adenylosuccinate lyase
MGIGRMAQEFKELQKVQFIEIEEEALQNESHLFESVHKRISPILDKLCYLAGLMKPGIFSLGDRFGYVNFSLDKVHVTFPEAIFAQLTVLIGFMMQNIRLILEKLVVLPENIKSRLKQTKGIIYSQRVFLELTKSGMMKEKAHNIIQSEVLRCAKKDVNLFDSLKENAEVQRYLHIKNLERCFDLNFYLRNIGSIFERMGLSGL